MVRGRLHPGFLYVAAKRKPAHRSPHHLRRLGMRLRWRYAATHRGGGRAAVPATPGLPDRHRRQVRIAALGGGVRCAPGRCRPIWPHGILRSGGAQPGNPPCEGAAAARSDHSGRVAPDFRAPRHHGRPLRGGDRGAVCAGDRRKAGEAQDRGVHGDGSPCAGPDSGALRTSHHQGLPAAGADTPRFVLRPHHARVG